ncbi:CHAT domain-containing protein [Amycolatopsis sp. NPDC004378]
MTSPDQDLIFHVSRQHGQIHLEVSGSAAKGDQRSFWGSATVLTEQNEAIREDLTKFKTAFNDQHHPSWELICAKLGELIQTGSTYLAAVFGDDNAPYIKRHLRASTDAAVTRPARLELRSTEDARLMLNFIPSGYYLPTLNPGPEAAKALARMLPAFSSIVRHVVLGANVHAPKEERDSGLLPQNRILVADPDLRIAFFWNEAIDGSDAERAFLEGPDTGQHVALDWNGPFPGEQTPPTHLPQHQAEYVLAGLLAGQWSQTDTGNPIQLVHVSAHSTTSGPGTRDRCQLQLGRASKYRRARRKSGRRVPKEMEYYNITNGLLQTRWEACPVPLAPGPLAVLSSCESAALSTAGALSLAGSLLRFGYRAVVGTETVITENTASRFFKAFYTRLLGPEPVSVGEALHDARLFLLVDTVASPLGCLFTVHGDPYLTVQKRGA